MGFIKTCPTCKEDKGYNDFHKSKNEKHGLAHTCKSCANAKSRAHHKRRMLTDQKYKDDKRASYIKHKHGISVATYEKMLKAQGYTCAICYTKLESQGSGTHLDHDHTTGTLREMLCTNCNRGLGHFQDNEDNLESAIAYLRKHSRRNS